jgi:hypothetical protein
MKGQKIYLPLIEELSAAVKLPAAELFVAVALKGWAFLAASFFWLNSLTMRAT